MLLAALLKLADAGRMQEEDDGMCGWGAYGVLF